MNNISTLLSKYHQEPVVPTITDAEAEIRILIMTLKMASNMLPGAASVETYNFPEIEAAQKLIAEHASELTAADFTSIVTGLKEIKNAVEAEVEATLIGRIKENPDASLASVIAGNTETAEEIDEDPDEDYSDDEWASEAGCEDAEEPDEDFELGEGVSEVKKDSDLVDAIREALGKAENWQGFAALLKTFNMK